ncbi:MAG: hypothetical protein LBF93_03595 [Zoogloeaceae bacterium]|nr:hypothetical protein [Zoogloeaceae bacterium]
MDRKKLLRDIIDTRFDGSQAKFARAIKRSPAQVHQWLNRHRAIGDAGARHIELTLGLPGGYFDKPLRATTASNTNLGPDIIGRVPLISWVQAGEWMEIVDTFAPGQADDWLSCPVTHSSSAFVLRVRGESMLNPNSKPSFHDGDLIFVDPERPAENGSLVVVRLDDAREATFKKLIIEGEHRYLRALNPIWPEPMIHITSNATICGVVFFKGEML